MYMYIYLKGRNEGDANSDIPVLDESLTIIKETDEKFDYILSIDGNQIQYIEITEVMDDGSKIIHTKSYNEKTNELLQDFETIIKEKMKKCLSLILRIQAQFLYPLLLQQVTNH